MNAPLHLRRFSQELVASRNAISARPGPYSFAWLGGTWSILLAFQVPAWPGRFFVEADWGGARMVACMDTAWTEQLGQAMLSEGGLDELPQPLLLALLETAFALGAKHLETLSRRPLRIVNAGFAPADRSGLTGLGLECIAGALTTKGGLWLDEAALACLAGIVRRCAPAPRAPNAWDGLPCPLRFTIGWVDLPTRILADTDVQDVIMLDECWLHGDDGITVQVGRYNAFRATLRDTVLGVTEGLGTIMADTLDAENFDERQSLDDVTIRLTFDLGERSITLGELRTLEQGFTFDLGRELRRSVTIRANGMAIGEGELVDIDGRVGVSVMSLQRFAE